MAFLLKQPDAITYLGKFIRGVKFGNGTKTVVVNGGIHAR
jgi:hypothetical protein